MSKGLINHQDMNDPLIFTPDCHSPPRRSHVLHRKEEKTLTTTPICLTGTSNITFQLQSLREHMHKKQLQLLESRGQYIVMKDRVSIIGSGNWGSAIATIIGSNVIQHSTVFEPIVHMWVFEEMVSLPPSISLSATKQEKYKLTEVINKYHENVKYLPNISLPHNIVATSSIETACCDATVLIFVLPHQFLNDRLLSQICNSNLNPTRCRAISLIKGIDFDQDTNRPKLISHRIQDAVRAKIPSFQCGVLMGANIANEVAKQQHVCESTLACDFSDRHSSAGSLNERTRLLFHNEQCFRIQHITDICLTEICGAIKNCVALGAGFVDGLHYGSNTKAALLRVGLHEMYHFALYFFPLNSSKANANSHPANQNKIQYTTMMESCGVADLITTCYSGRNRSCAATFARERRMIQAGMFDRTFQSCEQHWEDIERRILKGQKIQGVSTVYEVYQVLQAHDRTQFFPLLTTIYSITFGMEPVTSIVNGIRIYDSNAILNKSTTPHQPRIPYRRSSI